MKSIRKVKKVTTTIKLFTFIFCLWKKMYFARKRSLGKFSLYYYISRIFKTK